MENPFSEKLDCSDGSGCFVTNPEHSAWQNGYLSGKIDGFINALEIVSRVMDLKEKGITPEQINKVIKEKMNGNRS
jgi:hypothetical protein